MSLRFKYKIPPFVFGVSIGLLVGVAFFIFKIDDYVKKFNKPTIDDIKVTEQTIINAPSDHKEQKYKTNNSFRPNSFGSFSIRKSTAQT